MWLLKSSVGRKVVMSLTGLFLILFVTFHVLMNAVALISPAGYNAVCAFLGANWYALVGTLILAAGALIHIIYAFWLTLQNRKARGNDRYLVSSKPKNVEWASQNMLVLGIIVVCFFVVHLCQFWARMQLQEIMGNHAWMAPDGAAVAVTDGTAFLYYAFKDWWTLVVYLIGFGALWFHMTHGFWSAFQTLGTNNDIWMKRWRVIGTVWATAVCALFAVEAVAFTVISNNDTCKDTLLKANETECVAPCQAAVIEECEAACIEKCEEVNACVEECKAACEDAK